MHISTFIRAAYATAWEPEREKIERKIVRFKKEDKTAFNSYEIKFK